MENKLGIDWELIQDCDVYRVEKYRDCITIVTYINGLRHGHPFQVNQEELNEIRKIYRGKESMC